MEKSLKDLLCLQTGSKSNESLVKRDYGNPSEKQDSAKPNTEESTPDLEPGINEPEKNDPTRTEELPTIFNHDEL